MVVSFFEGYEKEAPQRKTAEQNGGQSFEKKLDDWLEEDPIGQKIGKLMDKFVEMDDKKVSRGIEVGVMLAVALAERRRAKKAFEKYQSGEPLSFRDYETLATYAIGRAAFVARELMRRHGVLHPPKKES